MVNPIYQQDEELLLNPFGSRYLSSGAYTDVNSNEFIVQEDTVISVLTGGDASISENSIDYKTSMNLSGVTLKKGALIVAPVGEAFKSITIDSGSVMAYNCVVGGTKPGSFVGLLDDYPDASAAYSLRKLRTAYTGDAIRVRRTDNATQDIGFDSNGELDTVSLLSFVGSGDGFVSTWYDQSGQAFDVTQLTASNQPQIVSSGSLITDGGKPIIDFDGVNDYLTNAGNIPYNGGVSWYGVQNLDTISNSKRIWSDDIIGVQGYNIFTSASPFKINDGGGFENFIVDNLTANTRQIRSFNFDDSNGVYNYAINGSNTSATKSGWVSPISGGTANVGIMSAGNGGAYGDGKLQELIIYPNDQATNREDIETNINDYYDVY